MRIFGYELSLKRKAAAPTGLMLPAGSWTRVFDFEPGKWQQDESIELDSVLTYGVLFACLRLISSDISKLPLKLIELHESGVWVETTSTAFSPVLRKPNSTQTRIKFFASWVLSKLIHGNTYVLKYRDNRGQVVSMRVLDPTHVQPLISESGDVFYRLRTDHLAQIGEEVTVPAREIIHDVYIAFEHPLVGVSPIGACGLSAVQGIKIQKNSSKLFGNMSRPAGILSVPGAISDETAARLKVEWEANYAGDNYGKTAVLGDGLEYKSIAVTATDAQLMEQLGWTGEDVCRTFGVPAYKVGIGSTPSYSNIEAQDQAYYSQCLQELIECIELLLDEGLELPNYYGVEFDLDGLIRMDSMTRAQVQTYRIRAGYLSPNEARKADNLLPVEGGDSPMSQQQNYSLAALAKRDAREDPFATAAPPQPEPKTNALGDPADDEDKSLTFAQMLRRELGMEAA